MHGHVDPSIMEIWNKIDCTYYDKPDSALWYIEKAMVIAREQKDSIALAGLYNKKGGLFRLVDPDRATRYLYHSLRICESIGYKKGIAISTSDLYTFTNVPFRKKTDMINKVFSLLWELEDTPKIALSYFNMANIYSGEGKFDSAQIFLNKGDEIAKKINYPKALSLIEKLKGDIKAIHYKDTTAALQYYYKVLSMTLNKPEKLRTKYNIMTIYFNRGRIDSAFHYFNVIKHDLPSDPHIQALTYDVLSEYYEKKEDVKKALEYDEKRDSVDKYLYTRNNENLLRLLEIEHEAQLKEEAVARLNADMAKAQNTRVFLIILIVLLLVIFVIIFRFQWQKAQLAQKNKQKAEAEKKLISTELENSELKRQYLNDELKFTNKELTSFATNIVHNHAMLNDLRSKIVAIGREDNIRRVKEQLKELNITLLQVFNNDEQRKELIEKSRQLNHSLIFYLRTRFKDLTDSDINLLILLMLKFTSKDIAVLYNIALVSAKKKRYRLRKKLGLGDEDSLDEFFDRLLEDARLKFVS